MAKVNLIYEGDLRVKGIDAEGKTVFFTDASKKIGGLEEYPSPTDLLGGALGACMLTTMALRAKKLGVEIPRASIKVLKELTHKHHIEKFVIEVACPAPIDPYLASELEKAALQCPIYGSLHPDIQKECRFQWNKQ